MTTTDCPVHIIEVDCFKCEGKGKRYYTPSDDSEVCAVSCPFCISGKRRRAVWQLTKQPKEVKAGFADEWFISRWIGKYSPYQSNKDLPTGETLEVVELLQGSTIIDMLSNTEQVVEFVITGEKPEPTGMKEFVLWSNENKADVDTWLCTALVKEKV